MQTPISIVADDREAENGVLAALRHEEDVTVTVRRLALGDYRVADRLLFERKTLLDLMISIRDGRLFRQAARLARASEAAALILEGTARDLAESGMQRKAVQGALVHVTLFLGLPLLRSKTPAETARLMCYAARQRRRLAKGTLPRTTPGRRPRGKRRAQLYLLQGLPGVGPKRAERLLNALGSIEAVVQADEEELTAVPGIGRDTATKIRWAVSEHVVRYEVLGDPVL